ncbi:MAG: hypothetical protein QM479_07160 [Pseudomonadota bacterium]
MITNIESTGFESLFKASEKFAQKTIEANTPTQKEKVLRADKRSLSRENFSLEAQNKLLEEKNEELETNNDSLTRQVKEVQDEQAQRVRDNAPENDTRSEEKARSANEIKAPASSANAPPSSETTTSEPLTYASGSDLSGIELGNTFNAFA